MIERLTVTYSLILVFNTIKILCLLFVAPLYAYSYDIELIKDRLKIGLSNDSQCERIVDAIKNEDAVYRSPIYRGSVDDFVNQNGLIKGCNNKNFVFHETILGNNGYQFSLKDIENDPEDSKLSWHHPLEISVYLADVNFDGTLEYLVYGSCLHGNSNAPDCDYAFTNFHIIDEGSCSVKSTLQVFDTGSKFYTESIAGLLGFDSKDYFYDGNYYENEEVYTLNIYTKRKNLRGEGYFYAALCRFLTESPWEKGD